MTLSDETILIGRAIHAMEQRRMPIGEINSVIRLLKSLIGAEKQTVYHWLIALTWLMAGTGHDKTGHILENAHRAFFIEGQGDDGDGE